MKKNRIFSVGALLVAAIALSACTATVSGPPLTNTEVRTSWVVPAVNEFVVCENETTTYEVRFDYPIASSVSYADILIRGSNIGRYNTSIGRGQMYADAEHDFVFDFDLHTDSTNPYPMSAGNDLSATAIIPTPIPPEVEPAINGEQTVIVTLRNSHGGRIGSMSQTFDVWGACK